MSNERITLELLNPRGEIEPPRVGRPSSLEATVAYPSGRARQEREPCRARVAVEVDHEIVASSCDTERELSVLHHAPRDAHSPEARTRVIVDPVDRRVALEDRRYEVVRDPLQLGLGIRAPHRRHGGSREDHVAEGPQSDDQDSHLRSPP